MKILSQVCCHCHNSTHNIISIGTNAWLYNTSVEAPKGPLNSLNILTACVHVMVVCEILYVSSKVYYGFVLSVFTCYYTFKTICIPGWRNKLP